MNLKLSVNESRQPTPGDRGRSCSAPLARRGCADRSAAMTSKTILLLVAILILPGKEAHASSYRVLKFGTPVLVDDKLVFAEPGREPHRLICIAKEGGKKLWEITDVKQKLQPWLLGSNQLFVTVGGDIENCDPGSGKLTLRHRSGYARGVSLKDQQDGCVLAQGEKYEVDYLSCLDAGSWRVVWEVPRITGVIAPGQGVLLCEQGTRKPAEGGGYSLVDQRWVALSKEDGRVFWSSAAFAQGAAVDRYFLVYLKDTIHCLNQRDGTTVKQFRIHQTPYAPVSFATKDQQLLVNTFEFSRDSQLRRTFFSLTIPGLEWSKLTESDWKSALGVQYEVRDDNYVYSSSIEPDGSNTTINRTEIKTGKREELYREPMPSKLRPQAVDGLPKR